MQGCPLAPGRAWKGEEARAPPRVNVCSPLEGPSQEHFALPPRSSRGSKPVLNSLLQHRGYWLSSSRWVGHATWKTGAIIPPILQGGKVRLREAKPLAQYIWLVRGTGRVEAGNGAGTSTRQVVPDAHIPPSPQLSPAPPRPLALSLTFNQVPVMSGPAVGAGPPQLPGDKWFSFEREVIKTYAQRHCQRTED